MDKILDFSPQQIKEYLELFRKCVLEGKYSIAKNCKRRQNISFIEKYKITAKKEKEILLGIQLDDFGYGLPNDNPEFPDEILYVFCRRLELDFWGCLEHPCNFELSYLFK